MATDLDLAVFALALLLDMGLRRSELPGPLHPVRWMGALVSALERVSPREGTTRQLLYGTAIALAVPALCALGAYAAAQGLQALPWAYAGAGALLLKSTFTLRGLTSAGEVTARLLENRDMAGVRTSLRSLVSRDPASLSAEQAAGAAVESVAENTTDSFIAPWLAFALFGLPGAFAYRAINTLDSMIGYRGRYEYLGKASARLDDLVNLIPARVSAGLLLVAGAVLRLDARRGWKVMRRDHARTASPNAGWTMGAMAGLLGVRLEKVDHYVLGAELQQPEASHIRAANRAVAVAATFGALCIMAWLAVRSS